MNGQSQLVRRRSVAERELTRARRATKNIKSLYKH
jgi:hypothetical protein